MKTYETWEMLKELAENPSKEFRNVSSGLHVKANEDGKLFWGGEYKLHRLDDRWKEVREPVDFLTAVENGKLISVEYLGEKYERMGLDELLYELGSDCGSDIVALFILRGKWYIEE